MKTLLLMLIAGAGLTWADVEGHTRPPVTHSRSSLSTSSVDVVWRDAAPDLERDAYGNDVTDAVAQYTLDSEGSLYEMHAPQVELPRLASPKS